jgi:hypothetical protein
MLLAPMEGGIAMGKLHLNFPRRDSLARSDDLTRPRNKVHAFTRLVAGLQP